MNPEPLPPERYEEQAPELNRTEHEPTDIPSTEYPDAQEDDVEQFWVDYASYSYGDDCINSETGPINQTCESADVDVAQDKKSHFQIVRRIIVPLFTNSLRQRWSMISS
uniref:Uncharacterized protein n=1 Tax=Klebsiella pneumoniae TaxID=573 RepID=A0A8B0SZI4_KLEPN|nr:hypothetical protein [Klebsiella pneumoniae]